MEEISREIDVKNILPSLSVCMIVRNEEAGLQKLLPILSGAVDEIIVVDTGSTDATKTIAEMYGAKVFEFPWCDDFAKARNESLKYATSDYIIWLDGDDIVERTDIANLKFHLVKNPNTGVFVRLIDYRNNTVFDSMQLRVFPNIKGIDFRGRVHEQISFALEEKGIKFTYAPFKVKHYGYESASVVTKKLERNLKILLEEVKEHPKDFVVLMNAARTALSMGKFAIGEPLIDRCLEVLEEGEQKVSKDHALMAYMTKATLYGYAKKDKESLKLLESVRHRFHDKEIFKLAIGEINFKLKKYKDAYRDLILARDGKLSISAYPVDVVSTLSNYTKYLLACSLKVGDYKTASICLGRMIGHGDFEFNPNKR